MARNGRMTRSSDPATSTSILFLRARNLVKKWPPANLAAGFGGDMYIARITRHKPWHRQASISARLTWKVLKCIMAHAESTFHRNRLCGLGGDRQSNFAQCARALAGLSVLRIIYRHCKKKNSIIKASDGGDKSADNSGKEREGNLLILSRLINKENEIVGMLPVYCTS